MSDKADLESAYALQNPDDSRKLYAQWASSYDADFVDANGYMLHEAVSEAFVSQGGAGPVLDIGAGTGSVGDALARRGVADIVATDISDEMLAQAAQKGLYSELFPGDILAGLDRPDGHYAGIVSAGTFTLGHVGPEALREVLRLLKPGGLAVISVRDVHYDNAGFPSILVQLEPDISRLRTVRTRIYAHHTDPRHADDIAVLLSLWKA